MTDSAQPTPEKAVPIHHDHDRKRLARKSLPSARSILFMNTLAQVKEHLTSAGPSGPSMGIGTLVFRKHFLSRNNFDCKHQKIVMV